MPASAEESRLNAAIDKADVLLQASLKRDEQRRKRRFILLASIGGFIMIGIIAALLITLAGGPTTSPADIDKAAQLSAQGWIFWQQRKLVDAEETFVKACELDPTNSNAWNGLGWSRFNLGQGDQAEEPFRKAVEIAPEHPGALNGLGQLYLSRGKLDDAEKYLLKAAPNASAAWWGLARVYLLQEKFDQALPWAMLVAREQPQEETVQKMLAAAKARKLDPQLKKLISPPAL